MVARIEAAQGDLDHVTVPGAVAAFVIADADRRAERIELMNQLADAVEANGSDGADAVEIDRVLNELNVRTEAEEDAMGLAHCP